MLEFQKSIIKFLRKIIVFPSKRSASRHRTIQHKLAVDAHCGAGPSRITVLQAAAVSSSATGSPQRSHRPSSAPKAPPPLKTLSSEQRFPGHTFPVRRTCYRLQSLEKRPFQDLQPRSATPPSPDTLPLSASPSTKLHRNPLCRTLTNPHQPGPSIIPCNHFPPSFGIL